MLGGPQRPYGDFERMEDLLFQRGINLGWPGFSSRTEVSVPTELSGMTHVAVLIMLI